MDQSDIGKKIDAGTQGHPEAARPGAGGAPGTDNRPGPGWRGWVISILVAVILSVATMALLCGPAYFGATSLIRPGACAGPCCPPAGK